MRSASGLKWSIPNRSQPIHAPAFAIRPDVVEVVAVADVRDHDPTRVDAVASERVERQQPGPLLGVRVDHHRRARLDRRHRDRLDDPRDVADEPVPLDGAFQERRLHAGVVDALANLADEQLGDRFLAPVGEEVRQLDERVHTGRDDDVDIGRLRHLADPGDVPAEPRRGRIDDRANPRFPHARELVHRIDDPLLLVPVAWTERVTPVLQRLGLHDEHVLVHERSTEVIQRHGASHGLDSRHGSPLWWVAVA